ncbi:hypothetical protein E2C01_094237 [Portunus trituberculatus]|uniref:Uncharacterized protein n=1 Tax=Portunus trituberculatus TaxID=210409 RepID=A0A5B7JWM6_PORTR|nr:hypothetical protein [Portunus trituberculatus]
MFTVFLTLLITSKPNTAPTEYSKYIVTLALTKTLADSLPYPALPGNGLSDGDRALQLRHSPHAFLVNVIGTGFQRDPAIHSYAHMSPSTHPPFPQTAL